MARKRVAHTIKKGGVADHAKKAGRCFVISPIGEEKSETRKHANKVLRTIVKPGLKEVGYTASRIDQISDTCSITEGIVEMLRDSRICVAILTNLNLNVMYEVGVRHAWDLPLITLAEEGTQLPFDIRDYSTIFYSMESDQKIKRAVRELTRRAKAIEKTLNRERHESPRMIDTFANSMSLLGYRYSLDALYFAKEHALHALRDQLRRIRLEVEKDTESGNSAAQPLSKHAEALALEFDELAAKVRVFEGILDHCPHTASPREHCNGVLEQLKIMQRDAWRMCKGWQESKGSKADFRRALKDLDSLIKSCQALFKSI